MTTAALFPIYGLFGGAPFGASYGVDTIAARASAAHPRLVRRASHSFYEGESILDAIDSLPAGTLMVLIGHSNGVCTATKVAEERPGRRFIIVGIDGTWVPPQRPHPLGANVIAALSIVGADNGSFVGHAALECAEGANVPIERIDTNTPHVAIDDDPAIQAACLHFIDKVLQEV